MEQALAHRILNVRKSAEMRGLVPSRLECGPDCFPGAGRVFGLDICARAEPGLAVLAFPPRERRVGRYEIVIPERIEEGC